MKTSYSVHHQIGFTFAVILGAWTTLLHAQPGSQDTNFNAVATSPPNPPEPFPGHIGFSVAAQPDGKVIAAGTFGVLRLLSDGSLDPTFQAIPPSPAPFTGAGSGVGAVALQPDGRILVSGSFTNAAGAPLPRIVRLNADGSIDSSFNLDPRAYPAGALALQPDGKVISAGSYYDPVHQEYGGFVRLRSDGSLDPGFDSRGIVGGGVFALAPGGEIYLAMGTTILRVNPDGSRDGTFAAQTHPSYGASALAVQPDGRLLVGSYSDGRGFLPPPLRRLLTNGTDDPGWMPPDMNGGDAFVFAILVQPDGKVLAGGNNLESFNGVGNANLGRLNPDGSVDAAFDTRGDLHYYSVEDMALAADGKVVVAGMQLSRPDITPGPGVWRLNNDLEPRGIEFTATSYIAHEGDGWVSISVRRTTGTNKLAIVTYAVRPGTATRWRDYFGGDGALVFRAGETLKRIRIYVVRDHKTEAFETVRFALVRARGGSIGPQRAATLTILDENNQCPAASDQSVIVSENLSLFVRGDGNIVIFNVANAFPLTATSPEKKDLQLQIASFPAHGVLFKCIPDPNGVSFNCINFPGGITDVGSTPRLLYVPDIRYSGTDSFSYTVNDGRCTSDVATVAITITQANRGPIP
jgi:uncharacterized delta-60 repeat protein